MLSVIHRSSGATTLLDHFACFLIAAEIYAVWWGPGLPAASSHRLAPCHHLFLQFINAFPGSADPPPPREIVPIHLTHIQASLIDVFQSPLPRWGAIVYCLAALTLPSGPCWAQLDSPIASSQICHLTSPTLTIKLCLTRLKNKLEKHVIMAIMMMVQ